MGRGAEEKTEMCLQIKTKEKANFFHTAKEHPVRPFDGRPDLKTPLNVIGVSTEYKTSRDNTGAE